MTSNAIFMLSPENDMEVVVVVGPFFDVGDLGAIEQNPFLDAGMVEEQFDQHRGSIMIALNVMAAERQVGSRCVRVLSIVILPLFFP